MEDNGIINPVIDLKINFRKPALFDDKLILTTSLKQAPSYMIELINLAKRSKYIEKLFELNIPINLNFRLTACERDRLF